MYSDLEQKLRGQEQVSNLKNKQLHDIEIELH